MPCEGGQSRLTGYLTCCPCNFCHAIKGSTGCSWFSPGPMFRPQASRLKFYGVRLQHSKTGSLGLLNRVSENSLVGNSPIFWSCINCPPLTLPSLWGPRLVYLTSASPSIPCSHYRIVTTLISGDFPRFQDSFFLDPLEIFLSNPQRSLTWLPYF